jgi:hypothetical protein
MQTVRAIKEKLNWTIKLKTYVSKDIIKKIKRLPAHWEETFGYHVS